MKKVVRVFKLITFFDIIEQIYNSVVNIASATEMKGNNYDKN